MPRLPSTFVRLALPLAAAALCFVPAAASAQVHDEAKIFSPQAVTEADASLAKIDQQYHKQLVVETIGSLPADQKAAAEQQGKEAFFDHLKATRANALGVNGVYVLICMDPPFIDDAAGRETVERGIFTSNDLSTLRQSFRTALHDKQYDRGLREAVDDVRRAFAANVPAETATAGRGFTGGAPSPAIGQPGMGGGVIPGGNSGRTTPPASTSHIFGIGGLLCLALGAFIIFSLIKSVFRRSGTGNSMGGTGFGGGGVPMGGGPMYPTGGPVYGGAPAGGGAGRGFLGGLLGGAVGGYAVDKFEHRNDGGQAAGPAVGDGGLASGGGGGGGFDSGPSDAGQGFGDSGGGADFSGGSDAGGGGGGDAGGGGGDQGSF